MYMYMYMYMYMHMYMCIYITRLASNEIFSPSKKIHREVGRAKDLSARQYKYSKVQAKLSVCTP